MIFAQYPSGDHGSGLVSILNMTHQSITAIDFMVQAKHKETRIASRPKNPLKIK